MPVHGLEQIINKMLSTDRKPLHGCLCAICLQVVVEGCNACQQLVRVVGGPRAGHAAGHGPRAPHAHAHPCAPHSLSLQQQPMTVQVVQCLRMALLW